MNAKTYYECKFAKKTQPLKGKGSTSAAMRTADKWFSLYIRARDVNDNGVVLCVTCGKPMHWKISAECGHFISRIKKLTRYNPQNAHPQCTRCNHKLYGGGEQFRHGQYIDKRYGAGTSVGLLLISRLQCKLSRVWYINESEKWREKFNELKNNKKCLQIC